MKSKVILISSCLLLIGCERSCSKMNKSMEFGERTYSVKMYSGGKVVFEDTFTGIVNNSESSDGIYYFKGDTLIEVSGDYTLKSLEE